MGSETSDLHTVTNFKETTPSLLYIYCSLGTQDSARNRTVSALRKLTLCWSDSYSRANRTTIRGTSASEKTARGQGAGGSLRVDRSPSGRGLWVQSLGGATQVSVPGRGNSVQEAGPPWCPARGQGGRGAGALQVGEREGSGWLGPSGALEDKS